ncbi:AAA family ATPase [Curtobacterium sp. MCBD17_028]|uniref:AAA family ATPase n=1 Tax=Curtobacterium sp. MCBD17_028 TaxID=2175670 RepID=UPI000DA7A340|nr:AAA family ATPase [Curtobacterium sp. MCBD17_028]PZE23351.1 ATPase [Curtobacterium sp. MCBD17_028]
MRPLLRIRATNFRSLRSVDVLLNPLNVLVGPNGAGKSNFLDLIEFLGDSARYDLPDALERRGGIDRVRFRGVRPDSGRVSIHVSANVTTYSSENTPDEYELRFSTRKLAQQSSLLLRNEEFIFKRLRGRGRRITVSGDKAEIVDSRGSHSQERALPLRSNSLALSTLRRLPPKEGGEEIDRFARLFTTFRVFNVDVSAAQLPSRISDDAIAPDGRNLASVLVKLSQDDQPYKDFIDDAQAMIPGFERLEFIEVGGADRAVAVRIVERGLRDSTSLADASFGTIRVLALLALLYDPNPPLLTCIEEIDHGLHPYLFDRLVERLREASSRTQLLVATHSPALVSRLSPRELIVVERSPDGETRLPAVDPELVAAKAEVLAGEVELGELWFSGELGGVPR